ncbi:hypothetical protein DM860_007972 [Cuscuta australis]|uniref:Uncharacterized protein n=1 Tax=Cuscuta australis TaxID=267555 RepID=A0A328E0K2_9ASTE|nr:hypothetical protein DM860_007972 [Cuscuta australis]
MELFALNRNCRNRWIIVAAVGDILAAFIGIIEGIYKFKKVHERMMPVCAPAAAAPASSYGGGGVVVEGGGEKYDCFAGNGVVVALGAAIILNVIAHVCIIVVAGSCCHCQDGDDGDDNSETKTHRYWTIFFEFMTWLMLVIGCVFLGMGLPRLEKKPSSIAKVCTHYNTTAAYHDGRPETNVCSAAWIPAVGGMVVAIHAVFGFLYAPFARKLSRAGSSGRSSN